jgi:glycerophosphoryl diester phosphodiesterase
MQKLILLLLVLSCFATNAQPVKIPAQANNGGRTLAEILKVFHTPDTNAVLVAAHRADWRQYPENSLEAIRSAINMGVDMVEIDVQRTSDGVLVLMHDLTVDRATNGKGLVSSYTLDSLKKLSLKNGLGRPTIFKIPTLEEALLTVKGRIMINLDKCYPFIQEAFVLVQKTGTLKEALFKGEAAVSQLKKDYGTLIPSIAYMPIIDLDNSDAHKTMLAFQSAFKVPVAEFIFKQDTAAVFKQLSAFRRAGSKIWINSLWASLNGGHDDDRATTDMAGSYGWILAHGATIIQTDRPELLLNYLRTKKLHP